MKSLSLLFIEYCPIIYFHNNEKYMPTDFDDILKVSNVSKDMLNKVNLLLINKKDLTKFRISDQILCKTSGEYTINNVTYIDLIYIIVFPWKIDEHEQSFDKAEIIVRLKYLNDKYYINNIYGSAHGTGMWYRPDLINYDKNRPILYCALNSHAIYNTELVNKRFFGFHNDITRKDREWKPSQFVVITKNSTNIYNIDNSIVSGSSSNGYLNYTGEIGNEYFAQTWPGSVDYNTINLPGFYKYDGGIQNMFSGEYQLFSNKFRMTFKYASIFIWISFLIYFMYMGFKINDYYAIIYIVVSIVLFLSGFYLGLEAFVLNK